MDSGGCPIRKVAGGGGRPIALSYPAYSGPNTGSWEGWAAPAEGQERAVPVKERADPGEATTSDGPDTAEASTTSDGPETAEARKGVAFANGILPRLQRLDAITSAPLQPGCMDAAAAEAAAAAAAAPRQLAPAPLAAATAAAARGSEAECEGAVNGTLGMAL